MRAHSGDDGNKPAQLSGAVRGYLKVDTQFENAGDALIVRELVRLVAARIPMDVYLGRAPESFVRQLDLNTSEGASPQRGGSVWKLMIDVLRARAGGSRCYLFLTPGAPNGEKSLKEALIGLARLGWVAALTAIGVRVCQVGISFERIGPRHARLLRWRSRFLYATVVREQIAYDYAQSLGIRVTGLMPDLSFNIFAKERPHLQVDRRCIAFSFRVDKDPSTRSEYTRIVTELCTEFTDIDSFVFLAQVGRDVAFMRELAELGERLRPGQVRFLDCHQDIDKAVDVYDACRAVISNRLHVLLPSIREGASPIALVSPELDTKISGVFDSIGIADRVLDVREVGVDQVSRRLIPVDIDGAGVSDGLNVFFDGLLERSAASI